MKKLPALLLLFSLATGIINAQVNTSGGKSWMDRFHSFNTVQLLTGSTTTSFAVNTVNGFRFGKFFSGIGTGIDYYYHRSVPLFIEARYDLVKRKGTLQCFANAGLNIPFSSQNNKLE